MTRHRTTLANPDFALASYLDELLHTATEEVSAEPGPVVQADPVVPAPEKKLLPAPEPEPVHRPEPEPEPEPGQVLILAPEAPLSVPPVTAPPPRPAQPEWSQGPFECLLFTVAGLKLAVPLVLLGAIHRIEDRICPLPGRPDWYLGMLTTPSANLKIVDSAEWIMSGKAPAGANDNYRLVIRLDASDWALAVDDVAQSFTLDPAEVRWRSSRSRRPWLAGTVIGHMCALLDVKAMARLLARSETEHLLDLG